MTRRSKRDIQSAVDDLEAEATPDEVDMQEAYALLVTAASGGDVPEEKRELYADVWPKFVGPRDGDDSSQ